MDEGATNGRVVAGVIVACVVVTLAVLTWRYPSRVGPFAAVFLVTGLVMLLRSRRSSGRDAPGAGRGASR